MAKRNSFKKRYKNVAFLHQPSNTMREVLEGLEKDIVRGNIKGLILIRRHNDGEVSYSRSGDVYSDNPYEVISTLERIKHQALEIIFEDKGII